MCSKNKYEFQSLQEKTSDAGFETFLVSAEFTWPSGMRMTEEYLFIVCKENSYWKGCHDKLKWNFMVLQ